MEARVHFCPNDLGVYSPDADLCIDCGGRLIVDRRGHVIGDGWTLDHLIGLGGMRSSVWEATREDGAVAAIKIAESDLESPDARRLIHSASLVQSLDHPNIGRVFAYGETDDGEAHVVMELLRGRTLLHLLQQRGVVTVAQAVHVVRETLEALDYLHGRGLVHRDVKPGNVHLSPRGHDPWDVRLIDFGVAKEVMSGAPSRIDLITESPGAWGRIVGTPEYMAPEQVLGAPVDGRADLYAVGIMLYRLVTGELPFQSADRQEVYELQLRRSPPPAKAPEGQPPLSLGLTTTLATALAKQPGDRFQSARSPLGGIGELSEGQGMSMFVQGDGAGWVCDASSCAWCWASRTSIVSTLSDMVIGGNCNPACAAGQACILQAGGAVCIDTDPTETADCRAEDDGDLWLSGRGCVWRAVQLLPLYAEDNPSETPGNHAADLGQPIQFGPMPPLANVCGFISIQYEFTASPPLGCQARLASGGAAGAHVLVILKGD